MSDENPQPTNDEEPRIYVVRKGLNGWQFNRRDFIAAASAAAAAGLAGCDRTPATKSTATSAPSREPTSTNTPVPEPTATNTPTPTDTPAPTPTLTPIPEEVLLSEICTTLLAHNGGISDLALNPDGTALASFRRSTAEGSFKLWSLPGAELLTKLPLFRRMALNRDGSLLATSAASYDTNIELWSLFAGELLDTFQDQDHRAIVALAMNTEGSLLALWYSADDDEIRFLSLADGNWLATAIDMEGLGSPIARELRFSQDGSRLIAWNDEGLQVWSLPTAELVVSLENYFERDSRGWPSVVAISPDGSYLASTGNNDNQDIRLLSLFDGQELKTLTGHTATIDHIAISPDGLLLASEGSDRAIRIWSPQTGELLAVIEDEIVSALAFSPDSSLLASGGLSFEGGVIKLWSLPDGNLKLTLNIPDSRHDFIPESLAFKEDGSLLVAGSREGQIRLWSLPDGTFQSCLVDLELPLTVEEDIEIIRYEIRIEGQTFVYYLPAGSPIPAGAVCVCNTVVVSGCSCVGDSGGTRHYWRPN